MVSQTKILNMFYLIIYWTQKVCNDFMFLCSIVLKTVTLILLTWSIWWARYNASRWQIGFNSAFKWLNMFYLIIYWTQKYAMTSFLYVVSHCHLSATIQTKLKAWERKKIFKPWLTLLKLTRQSNCVVWIFVALLNFSFNFPSY